MLKYSHMKSTKSLREIIAENILTLRKKHKLTQIELAEKINYSDKAVSRWEKSEVVPDVETLQSIGKVFNVSVNYMLEDHSADESTQTKIKREINRVALMFFAILSIWLIATIVFVYMEVIYDYTFWQVFVWAVPVTSAIGLICCEKWGKHTLAIMISSVFIWSLIASIYLQLLSMNLWLIFIIGVPLQCLIIVAKFMKPVKKKKK